MTDFEVGVLAAGTRVQATGWLVAEESKLLIAWFDPMPTSPSWPAISLRGAIPAAAPYPARVTGWWVSEGTVEVQEIVELHSGHLGEVEAFNYGTTYVPDVYFVDPTREERAFLDPLLKAETLSWYRVGHMVGSTTRGVWAGSPEPQEATVALHELPLSGTYSISVAESPWSMRELLAVQAQVQEREDDWKVLTAGAGIDTAGRMRLHITVLFPQAPFVDFVRTLPAGMVSVSSAVSSL
jgi:hypothetical protein